MLFSSITFLYYFLPIVLLTYFFTPTKYRNVILFISSLFFYAWGEPTYIILMLVSISVGYFFALGMNRFSKYRKIIFILSLVITLGFLFVFKYTNFFITNLNALLHVSIPLAKISLPIGISFYTFQIVSYLIDVYRNEVQEQKSFLHLATYISLFPQLIAGPIVRYKDVALELEHRTHSFDKVYEGIRRFMLGLGKKILIANTMGAFVVSATSLSDKSILLYWMLAIAIGFQIYFDFSGYSDMAIGLGKIFGFHFMENFNYPFIADSITDFWRRWHISLGSWFRDYVYIPLGGSRCSKARGLFNIFVVWFLTGFWHGAEWNFILWGLFFWVVLMFEKRFLLSSLKDHKVIAHIYVIFLVLISFIIFNSTSLGEIVISVKSMLGMNHLPLYNLSSLYYIRSYIVVFIIAVIGSTPLMKKLVQKIKWSIYLEPFLWIVLLVVCSAYLIDGSFNPFLYFRF